MTEQQAYTLEIANDIQQNIVEIVDDLANADAYAKFESDKFNASWASLKNEAAIREAELEAAAFMADSLTWQR